MPESYYLKNNDANVDLSQFTVVNVGRGSSVQVEIKVEQPKSVVR